MFECVCSDTGASKSTRSSAKEQAAPEIALCINGGGLTPPAEMYGQPPSIWTYICHPEANAEKLPWWTGVFRGQAQGGAAQVA